jgi:hypothetical protein
VKTPIRCLRAKKNQKSNRKRFCVLKSFAHVYEVSCGERPCGRSTTHRQAAATLRLRPFRPANFLIFEPGVDHGLKASANAQGARRSRELRRNVLFFVRCFAEGGKQQHIPCRHVTSRERQMSASMVI